MFSESITQTNKKQGRAHQHGGFAPWQCTLNIRILARLGVKTLVVTNAAGGLNADYRVGDIMIIRDHIDLPGIGGRSALIGADERFGERFLSMANAYDVALRRKAMRIAVDERIGGVREGKGANATSGVMGTGLPHRQFRDEKNVKGDSYDS